MARKNRRAVEVEVRTDISDALSLRISDAAHANSLTAQLCTESLSASDQAISNQSHWYRGRESRGSRRDYAAGYVAAYLKYRVAIEMPVAEIRDRLLQLSEAIRAEAERM